MIPQVTDVFELARVHLGDTAVPGGQIATDSMLTRYWPNAWNSLYRYLDRNNNKRLRRTQYSNIPANTAYLLPADIGMFNFGRPEAIYDRAIQSTFNATVLSVNPAVAGTPSFVDLTIPAHNLQAGGQVVAFGFGWTAETITEDINGEWYIGVPNPSTIRLNGCAALDRGNAISSTGIISTGSAVFPAKPIRQLFDIDSMPLSATNGNLSQWKWENGAIHLVPSSSPRQLKVVYMLSGNPPEDGSIGLDDAGDALSLFLAATIAAAKGFSNKSQSLFMRALGNPSGETTNIEGGAFYELAQLGAQEINRTRIIVGRYRPRRNTGPIRGW